MGPRQLCRTAGVIALVLAGGGLAGASNNICFPQPKFVYGGDPDFTSLTSDNITRWTGGAGFGWASGSTIDDSYETALIDKAADSMHPEISPQQLLFGFMRQSKISFVDPTEGVRVGFSYTYTDSHTSATRTAQQIIHVSMDPGGHDGWSTTPPLCTAASTGICANDPNGDPALFVNFKPSSIEILAQTDDGKVGRWPSSGDITQWVKDNSRVWIFGDFSGPQPMYWWRMHVALPVRRTSTGATAPDPGVTDSWTSPSIFLDEATFSTTASTKEAPKFWVDFVTTITDNPMFNYLPYPDSTDLSVGKAGSNRDSTFHVPAVLYWGTGELGSPRVGLTDPSELQCSGGGITIAASTMDKAVYHSDIWNATAGTNSSGLFADGGNLAMVDSTGALTSNVMAVEVTNTSPTAVDKSALSSTFLIAPYGSQAIGTIWSPLVTGGNDYTCSGSSAKGQTSCQPVPINTTNTIPAAANGNWVVNPTTSQPQLELDMTGGGWKASADYLCAVQESDTGGAWFYQDPKEAVVCANAVYKPNGVGANGQGLPAHQCIQAQLSANSADVQFATKSAFRNMHQASASLHRETASIDTRGLTRIKGQTYHDIYLYVETYNMPYRVDAGSTPVTYNQAMQFFNYCSGASDGGIPGIVPKERANPCPPGDYGTTPAPSDNFFTKYMPTFIVKAYADVGVRYKTPDGRSLPVMQRLTSFGQFVTHDATTEGPVYGWDAGLEPVAGTQFQKVGPNTYRIRVPNDAAGQVVTHVEPLPTKRPVCTGTVNMNIVQLLQAIAPLITVSPQDAGEINALIDSLQIQCVDLKYFLDKIAGEDWGGWTSWVQFLVTEVEAAAGCNCK